MESYGPGLTWAKVPCAGLPGFCGCCSQAFLEWSMYGGHMCRDEEARVSEEGT